jgi:hypothetical protein
LKFEKVIKHNVLTEKTARFNLTEKNCSNFVSF